MRKFQALGRPTRTDILGLCKDINQYIGQSAVPEAQNYSDFKTEVYFSLVTSRGEQSRLTSQFCLMGSSRIPRWQLVSVTFNIDFQSMLFPSPQKKKKSRVEASSLKNNQGIIAYITSYISLAQTESCVQYLVLRKRQSLAQCPYVLLKGEIILFLKKKRRGQQTQGHIMVSAIVVSLLS